MRRSLSSLVSLDEPSRAALFPDLEKANSRRSMNGLAHGGWQRYGFLDAFNPLTGWYDTDLVGINVELTMLIAKNLRGGFVWNRSDVPGKARLGAGSLDRFAIDQSGGPIQNRQHLASGILAA